MPILSLLAKLGLDKTGFDTGMDNASKQVNKFGGDIKRQIAGGFTIAALASVARHAMESAHKFTQMAKELNITTDQAQQLTAEADRTGQSISDLTKDADKLNETLARIGGGEVLFSREQIEELERARQVIGGFKNAVGQEMANLIENPGLLLKRMVYPLLGTDTGDPERTELTGRQEAFLEKDAAKKRKTEHQEIERLEMIKRAAAIQKQADDATEKNRLAALSDEERMNELVQEREKIFQRIATNAEERAQKELDLRKNEADLMSLSKTKPPTNSGNAFSIAESSFGRIGAFTGAAARAAMPPGIRELIASQTRLEQALTIKGIIVKDVKR